MATVSSSSYTDRSSKAFSPDSILFSLPQSILYWQKFLLIFATIMVPHQSPTTGSDSLRFQSLYRLPKCTSEDGSSSNAFPHNGPTSEPNKYKSTRTSPTTDRSCLGTPFDSNVFNASPNAPPTTDHFPRFSQRFTPFFHGFTKFFHGLPLFYSIFPWFYSIFPWFSSISKVLLDFSMVLTPFSHSFVPFFHGLPNFQMVLLNFSLVFP